MFRNIEFGSVRTATKEYIGALRHSPTTDYIVYNSNFWEESKPKSQAVAHDLTTRQLDEAEIEMSSC